MELQNIFFLFFSLTFVLFLYYLKNGIIVEKKTYKIDNHLFFDPTDFIIFDELKNNWKTIQQEAKHILETSPKLNISRRHSDWKNSHEYINTIIDKYGWIQSWKNTSENGYGNKDWLNYGILYDGMEFKSNILQCPQTYNMLEKIKDKINIAGFSYMKGNSILQKHNDSTGIMYNSLAFHLGLIIPEPNTTCQLIVNNGYNDYFYTEREGEMVVFDSTYEHYAYNQSHKDRVILYIDFKI